VRVTASGALSVLLSVTLVLISVRASNSWLLLVGCALLTPVLLAVVLRPDLRAVSVGVRGRRRVAVGERTPHVFTAHNEGRSSTPALRLTHTLECFEPVTFTVPGLPPGGRAQITVPRTATARGLAGRHWIGLTTTAPFGMTVCTRRIPVIAQITVHPAPAPPAELTGPAAGEQSTGRSVRSGADPHGLREWRRGDGLRQVHWRATARHDRLTVVVPEAGVRPRFALVVGGSPADERWEELLATAAWTAVRAVHETGPVYLAAAQVAGYAGEDVGAVLDWFAGLGEVADPSPGLLGEAFDWAGPDGVLVLATTRAGAGPDGVVVLGPAGQARA
jgi:uncharacterized protein (DUF58 family)